MRCSTVDGIAIPALSQRSTLLCHRRGVSLRFQRDQAKAMQRYFQQQKAAEVADRSQCACPACPSCWPHRSAYSHS